MSQKSVTMIILSKIIAILLLLFSLSILTGLKKAVSHDIFSMLVDFLNKNITLVVVIIILFLIADLFWIAEFPKNMPAPLFYTIAAMLVIRFLLDMLLVTGDAAGLDISHMIRTSSLFFYIFVAMFVLLGSYIVIFLHKLEQDEDAENKKKDWKQFSSRFEHMVFHAIDAYSKAHMKHIEKPAKEDDAAKTSADLDDDTKSSLDMATPMDKRDDKSKTPSDTEDDDGHIPEFGTPENEEYWKKKIDKEFDAVNKSN